MNFEAWSGEMGAGRLRDQKTAESARQVAAATNGERDRRTIPDRNTGLLKHLNTELAAAVVGDVRG